MTINQFYREKVRQLPAGDRLRLASLILDDLSVPDVAVVDSRDEWSEADLQDVTNFAVEQLDDDSLPG